MNTMDMTDADFMSFVRRRAKSVDGKQRLDYSDMRALLHEALHRMDAIMRTKRLPHRRGGVMRAVIQGTPQSRDLDFVGTVARMTKRDPEAEGTIASLVVWARRLERDHMLETA
jgi:hypothetical protein